MADFFRGLTGGFQSGLQLGQAMRDKRQREELAQVFAKPESYQDYTPEGAKQIQGLTASGGYDVQAVPGAEGAAPTLRFTAKPNAMYYGPDGEPEAPIEIAPQQVQRYGGQTVAGQFDPNQLRGLQMREAARVLGAGGDPIRAAQLLQQAEDIDYNARIRPLQEAATKQQVELGGLNLRAAQRTANQTASFDTAFDEINKTEYKTPAERDTAVLSAVERFKGPEAAAALRANYSTNERNNILTQGAKFDQTIKQARLKGPAAALKAIDDLNDSFTLEIDGFKVTQVNKDGSRVPFLEAKTADEFALSVDARIKEGGAFELAKFRQDEQSKKALNAYYEAKTREAGAAGSAAANQLSGVQIGYSRDANGRPIQVMSGLRFNKKSGQLESVQVQLEQNVVPPSALDPKKIAEQAETLVGQPIDPTNKKSKDVHTFATAQQAVVDQIFNQYLGTGGPAGGLDLSPAAVAEKMLNQQPPTPAAPKPTAPRQTGSVGIDTNRPRTDVNPVTGQPRETPPTAPNLVAAVNTGLDAAQERYKVYLQNKIANNQALTPDETLRARRFGLQ